MIRISPRAPALRITAFVTAVATLSWLGCCALDGLGGCAQSMVMDTPANAEAMTSMAGMSETPNAPTNASAETGRSALAHIASSVAPQGECCGLASCNAVTAPSLTTARASLTNVAIVSDHSPRRFVIPNTPPIPPPEILA